MGLSEQLFGPPQPGHKDPMKDAPPSPCINICRIEGAVCTGCGRTLDEIAAWPSLKADRKTTILMAAKERLRRLLPS